MRVWTFGSPGTDVYATGDGTVVQMGWQSGYGNRIVIDHGFGYQTVYAHLRDFRTKLGKKVVRGEVIGGVGSTGKSTGPHLHYEVHVKGKVVNPVNYYFMDLSAEDYDRNNRFGAFPSFSIGWRISEEEFFKADWVDNLKLRASWGLLGNQETVNSDNSSNYYPYQNTYLFGYDYSFGNTLTPGISISNPMANQDITWEKTDQWNVGVDAAFWGNKLTLGADWFRKETRDILLQLPVPNMMGVSAPMQNAGVVRNTGIELQLGHNNRINDWSYSIGANFSYVTTKIMDLKGGDTPGQSVGDPLWHITATYATASSKTKKRSRIILHRAWVLRFRVT